MPHLLLVTCLCLLAFAGRAQKTHLPDVPRKTPANNIEVKPLDTDTNHSSYVIWVNEHVKPHYHQHHTEVVCVIAGTGVMTLGEETFPIGPGDYILIEPGTIHSVQTTGDTPLQVLSVQTPEFDGTDRIFVE